MIKKFKQFNESNRSDYNSTMNISDLIEILEKTPNENIIISFDLRSGDVEKNIYCINEFVQIPSDGMKMDSYGYLFNFDGDEYNFFKPKVENIKMSQKFIGNGTTPTEIKLPKCKTVGEILNDLKKIPEPDKSLLFIEGVPTSYNNTDKEFVYYTIKSLSTYNVETYPLVMDGEIITGSLKNGDVNMFMNMGTGKEFNLIKK